MKSHADKILKFLLENKDPKDKTVDWDKFYGMLEDAYQPLENDLADNELEANYRFFLSAAFERSVNFITEHELISEYEDFTATIKKRSSD